MGICYSMSHSQCDMCEKSLSVDHNRNILYKFQGCGKYHNKKICNLCFQDKFGYTLLDDYDFSTGIDDDPLGMKVIIYRRLT